MKLVTEHVRLKIWVFCDVTAYLIYARCVEYKLKYKVYIILYHILYYIILYYIILYYIILYYIILYYIILYT